MTSGHPPLLVGASSPSAIDYTALAMAGAHPLFASRRRIALVKQDARIAEAAENRAYEPRFGLPLARLERDPSGDLRQQFVPIDRASPAQLESAILAMGESYAECVLQSGGRTLATGVLGNARQLASRARERFRVADPAIVRASTSAIAAVFDLLESAVDVEVYERMFPKLRPMEEMSPILVLLWEQMQVTQTASANFAKGGALEIVDSRSGQVLDRTRSSHLNGRQLVMVGDDGYEVSWTPPDGHIALTCRGVPVARGTTCAVLRGPLDLLKMMHGGQLSHIPWYCEVMVPGSSAIEMISPLTVVSRRRSGFHTAEPFRLHPAGATLFDYEGDTIKAFVQGVLGTHWTNSGSPHEQEFLRTFIDCYVSQNQVGSKSRRGMREYFDHMRQECFQQRPLGTLQKLEEILRQHSERDVFFATWQFLALYDVMDYLASCASPDSPLKIDENIEACLHKAGLLIEGELNVSAFGQLFQTAVVNYETDLSTAGFPVDSVSLVTEQAVQIGRSLNLMGYLKMGPKGSEHNRISVGQLKRLAHLSSEVAMIAGDYAVLWLNTLLSANLFSVYLLLGRKGLSVSFQHILEMRGGTTFGTALPVLIVPD